MFSDDDRCFPDLIRRQPRPPGRLRRFLSPSPTKAASSFLQKAAAVFVPDAYFDFLRGKHKWQKAGFTVSPSVVFRFITKAI